VVWKIKYTEIAAKQMKKLDKPVSKKIDAFLTQRVSKQKDPRVFGKCLLHEKFGLWRYRVEDYRIICQIKDDEFYILVIQVGHRKEVYDK